MCKLVLSGRGLKDDRSADWQTCFLPTNLFVGDYQTIADKLDTVSVAERVNRLLFLSGL